MLQSIIIENFKCFKKISVPLKKVTVIVGSNGSGKTAFGEVLEILTILKKYPEEEWKEVLPHRFSIYSAIVTDGVISKDIRIEGEGEEYEFSITTEWRSGAATVALSGFIPNIITLLDVNREKIIKGVDVREIETSGKFLSNDAGNLLAVLWRLSTGELLPAGAQYTKIELPDEIYTGMLNFFEYYNPFLVLEDGRIKLIVEDERKRIQILAKNLPSGFFKVLAILTALELKPDVLFIDEFENSLHLGFQEIVFKPFIVEASTQVIITTHSPIPIDVALKYVGKQNAKIIGFDLNVAGYTVVKDFEEEEEILSFLENKGICRSYLYLRR